MGPDGDLIASSSLTRRVVDIGTSQGRAHRPSTASIRMEVWKTDVGTRWHSMEVSVGIKRKRSHCIQTSATFVAGRTTPSRTTVASAVSTERNGDGQGRAKSWPVVIRRH